jgi:hypothetical protein
MLSQLSRYLWTVDFVGLSGLTLCIFLIPSVAELTKLEEASTLLESCWTAEELRN